MEKQMGNYGDLSSEELKRTLAERQETLRKIMTPDEYKKFMQEIDDCQIKIDYSKFGKPVDFQEEKKEKSKFLLFFATVLAKLFPIILTVYTLAIIPILFLVWQIYKLISIDGWNAIFHTSNTLYVIGYIVVFFILIRLQTAVCRYANK